MAHYFEQEWIYDTTREEKKIHLDKYPNLFGYYLDALSDLEPKGYIKFLKSLNIGNLLTHDFKGNIYFPQDKDEQVKQRIHITILSTLLTLKETLNIEFKSYDYLRMLNEYKTISTNYSLVYFTDYAIDTFDNLYTQYKLSGGKLKINEIFDDIQDFLKMFKYSNGLGEYIKKHFNLILLDLHEHFNIFYGSIGMKQLAEFVTGFTNFYFDLNNTPTFIILANDEQLQQMFLKKGKQILNDFYQEIIDRLKGFQGGKTTHWEITKVDAITRKIKGITKIDLIEVFYKGKDESGNLLLKLWRASRIISLNLLEDMINMYGISSKSPL